MGSVQMNVRIDGALKASGDSAFSEIGITPTEAVRRLWGFASRNRTNRQAIASLMESLRDSEDVRQNAIDRERLRAEAEDWAASFQQPVRDCYAELGMDFGSVPSMTFEEQESLLEGAYDEKFSKWLDLA